MSLHNTTFEPTGGMDANGTRVAVRSVHGCWTCRLRRKKCDESRPSCSTCTCLEIECDGYGPKPDWMDRGPLERSKALQVKQAIGQNKHKRQKSLALKRPHSAEVGRPTYDSLDLDFIDWEMYTPRGHIPFGPALDEINVCKIIPASHGTKIPSAEPLVRRETSTSTFIPPTDLSFAAPMESLMMNTPLRATQNLTGVTSQTLNDNALDDAIEDGTMTLDFSTIGNPLTFSPASNLGDSLLSPRDFSIHDSKDYGYSFQGEQSRESTNVDHDPVLIAEHQVSTTEDSLFVHYLDEVFPAQYPFYHCHGRRERGWLFSILRRFTPAYHAALALSRGHRSATLNPNNKTGSQTLESCADNKHYNIALEGLEEFFRGSQTWNEATGLLRCTEILTCILHLLFCELHSGGAPKWQIHLQRVSALIPVLIRAEVNESSSKKTNHKSEIREAMNFLLGYFVSFDILARVSIRSSSLLSLDHKEILRKDQLNLETLIGCENWVMEIILDISTLDDWKKNAHKSKRLSIVELANQGGQIESKLRRKLADMDKTPTNAMGQRSMSLQSEITKIFALSATTYLHVVLSGAYPELPEIVESVSKTIDAFRTLSDKKVLPRLSWCFCVTGCLSLESRHSSFRELFVEAEIDEWEAETCLRALEVIEECWDLRKTRSSACDWVSAMDKRAQYSILF